MRAALTYPVRGPGRGDVLVGAWVLLLANGLVPLVPLVLLLGLLLGVLVGSARGDDQPPELLADLPGLLRDSVGAVAVTVGYVGLPVAFLLGVVQLVGADGLVEATSLVGLLAATAGGLAMLVAAYLLPVGLVRYGTTGSLRAAFDRTRLRRGARSGRYLLGWLGGAVVIDAAGLTLAAAAQRGGLVELLGALAAGYALLVGTRLVGRGLVDTDVADGPAGENP